MPNRKPRSILTASQQGHVRASMMKTASQIAHQLDEYVQTGMVKVAGHDIPMTTERLASYRLILDRTIPTLSSTEVTHKSALEGMGTEQIVGRLAELVRNRPELRERLMVALGGKLIEGTTERVPSGSYSGSSATTVTSQPSESVPRASPNS